MIGGVITKYQILEFDQTRLTTEVNSLILKGWQPYGQPFVRGNGTSWVCQAMVKYANLDMTQYFEDATP